MAKETADSASQLVDRLVNDAQFRETVAAAPTLHDKAQVITAAGYGNVNLHEIQEAVKERLTAVGAGVQVDPERAKRAEELFFKAAYDKELQQALQAAATPEAKHDVMAKAGYGDITVEDLRAAAARMSQREELTDVELEIVSVGGAESAPAWLGSLMPVMAASGGLGFAVGGPIGAGVGVLLGMTMCFVGAFAIPDPPPPSDW